MTGQAGMEAGRSNPMHEVPDMPLRGHILPAYLMHI